MLNILNLKNTNTLVRNAMYMCIVYTHTHPHTIMLGNEFGGTNFLTCKNISVDENTDFLIQFNN